MIYETDFQKSIENAFLVYGASVAQERAIPDVRDNLKIGLRQGLYAQYSNKLTHKDKFQKAQKSVASAMAQSYVHGDAAMYDTFIRAAKPFAYRYPLEEAQGAYGSPCAPDDHSASRYVEMRSSELSDYFFKGLKKNTIADWYWNYDDTERIPSVFPSIGFWNIVNGCSGIAVAMATSVPQFNLREVNLAIISILQNPQVDFNEIYCAPDFATGGTILNGEEVKESLRNGFGKSIRLRAKLEYSSSQNMIQATELPYGVYTNTIIEQLKEQTEANENYGIEKVVDHTKKTADIRIYLTKGTNPKKMIEKLYKDTSLENWFSINMIMLDMGRFPKVFNWRSACDAYITHIRTCKRRELQFDLDKALARENIVKGLLIACASIDEVVSIIRASDSPTEASEKLIARFNFNEEQTKAILAMKLSSLTKIDAIKLNDELAETKKKIECLNDILGNPQKLDAELIKILREVADKFGDERRTKIINVVEEEENEQEQVEEKDVAVMLFSNNSIRMVAQNDILGAKKGRKGKNLPLPKNAKLVDTLYTTNLSSVYAITQTGKLYSTSLSHLSENEDFSLYELGIDGEDRIVKVFSTMNFDFNKYLCFFTKQGMIKKTLMGEYLTRTRKGTQAIKLKPGDEIIECLFLPNDKGEIMTASSGGCIVRFAHEDIAPTGRVAIGVKGMKLENGETLVSACYIDDVQKYKGVLTLSSKGKGKITSLDEFSCTNRTAKGVIAQKLDSDEKLNMIYLVKEEENNFNLLTDNTIVSLSSTDIPVQGRATSGNKLIDLKDKNIKVKVLGR